MFYKVLSVFSMFLLIGCGSSSSSIGVIKSEKSGFLKSRSADVEDIVMLNLEANQETQNDLQGTGYDRYTTTVSKTHLREYCLENDLGAGHRFTIEDVKSNTLLDITEGCADVTLLPGVYTYTLFNGNISAGKSHSVFIYPKRKEYTLLGASNSLQKLLPNAKVQTKSFNTVLKKRSVISFNKCEGCSLQNIDLSHQAFDEQFIGSNLSPRMNTQYFTKLGTTEIDFFTMQNQDTNAYKAGTLNLQKANLNSANLTYSVFRNANFNGADFRDANLSHAVFIACSFLGATFDNVDMTSSVFIGGSIGTATNLQSKIISRPAITRVFQGERYRYFYEIIVAVDSDGRVVVNDRNTYRRLLALPNNLYAISAPTTVPNNFGAGYSIFVKASDGFVYEYFNKGYSSRYRPHPTARYHKFYPAPPASGWSKMNGSDICKSNPDATFRNFGGTSSSNELLVTVACHNKNGTLYTWERNFYNKYNTKRESKYGSWSQKNYSIPKIDAEISINRARKMAYISDKRLYFDIFYRNYKNYKHTEQASYASNVDLRTESISVVAFVKDDGNVYIGSNGVDSVFSNFGAPSNGVISAPALGGVWVRGKSQKVVVLSGDGRLYVKDLDNRNASWFPAVTSPYSEYAKQFIFTNNNLTEAYFENIDFSNMDLSSNTLTKTFFTKSTFNKTKLNGMALDETVFDASSFQDMNFSLSSLTSTEFTNNTNMQNIDFSGATINGFTWKKNTARCLKLDRVTFGDGNITSSGNEFNTNNCSSISFRGAKNIPVELVLQKTTQNVGGTSAQALRDYDFSSASFSPSFYTLDFKNTDMSGAKFGAIDASFARVDFKSIDATGSNWTNADLSFVKCDGCTFDNTTLNSTNLYQAHMNKASFISSNWKNTNAAYAQFQNGVYDFIDINKTSSIIGTAFNKSVFYKASLSGLNFRGTSFSQSKLNCSDLSNASLSNSNFSKAQLLGTNLSSPTKDIGNSSFANAYLNGANFQSVTFSNSDLSDAKFDFSGSTMVINSQRQCDGYVKKPSTISSTTCQNGFQPSESCILN